MSVTSCNKYNGQLSDAFFSFFLDEIVVAHLTWRTLQVIIDGQSWLKAMIHDYFK